MKLARHLIDKLVALCTLGYLLLLAIGFSNLAYAQSFTRDEVKAALTTHVIKNVLWPNEENKSNVSLVVWGDKQTFETLQVLSGITVRDKQIQVSSATKVTELVSADVVYVAQSQLSSMARLVSELRGSQTLVITENSTTLHNVMINIVDSTGENTLEQLRFQINRPNIAFEKLTILPELILFGGSEIDVAELYYQTEQAIKNLQSQNDQAFTELTAQQQELTRKEQKLAQLQNQMNALNSEMDKRLASFRENEAKLRELQDKVESVGEQYNHAVSEAEIKQSELEQAKQALSSTQQDLSEFKQQVDQQRSLLGKQDQQIMANQGLLSSQRIQLNEAQTEVKSQSELIDKQRDIIYIVVIIVIFALTSFLTISILFFKNKKNQRHLAGYPADINFSPATAGGI